MTATSTDPAIAAGSSIPKLLRRQIEARSAELCILPETAIRAIKTADDPECTVIEFVRIIERDVKLATDILALSNSAMYAPTRPITGLNQAVSRLGFRRCRNLVIASGLTSLMRRISLDQEWMREQLCHHGFLTALVASQLNESLETGFEGEDFTAGLVHDIGRTVLAVAMPDRISEFDPMTFDEDAALLDQEQSILGTDHATVGAWFAQNSGLPESLVYAIGYHHRPEAANHHKLLAALTAAADHAANHLQCFEEVRGYDPETNQAVQLIESLGIPQARERFALEYQEIMNTALEQVVNFS